VLLGLASLATAWSAYQARQWTGIQASETGRATAARISVNRDTAAANRSLQIDVATFIQWVNAHEEHRDALAAFYAARFRPQLRTAFVAWLAARPFTSKSAPKTPFGLPQYRLSASARADRSELAAAAHAQAAKDANQRADNYMLAVVLFASALFFAGISTKLELAGPRTTLVALGWVIFLGALVWLATLPVQLTT